MRWWRRLSTAKILAFARPWRLWWQLVWLIQTGLDNPDYDVRWEKKDYVNWFCDLGPQPLQGIICKLWYFSWLEMKLVGEESHSFQSTQLICLLHHVTCQIQGRKPWHNCPRPLERRALSGERREWRASCIRGDCRRGVLFTLLLSMLN